MAKLSKILLLSTLSTLTYSAYGMYQGEEGKWNLLKQLYTQTITDPTGKSESWIARQMLEAARENPNLYNSLLVQEYGNRHFTDSVADNLLPRVIQKMREQQPLQQLNQLNQQFQQLNLQEQQVIPDLKQSLQELIQTYGFSFDDLLKNANITTLQEAIAQQMGQQKLTQSQAQQVTQALKGLIPAQDQQLNLQEKNEIQNLTQSLQELIQTYDLGNSLSLDGTVKILQEAIAQQIGQRQLNPKAKA
jgi:hypothetical protein